LKNYKGIYAPPTAGGGGRAHVSLHLNNKIYPMSKSNKKKIYPIGIFLIQLIILLLLSISISSFYFYFTIKKELGDIVKNTQNYSISLAEAFARVAELSYPSRKYYKLKSLFQDKIQENIIDEAFFVLSDGKIIVHSKKEIAKKLKGNIANDEFAYNIDLIMLPLRKHAREAQFVDYNIINTKIPFDKRQRYLIKKYLYNKIDITGWLVNRVVFVKNKPIGTVNFIISKHRIYGSIFSLLEESAQLLFLLSIISLTVSIFISSIIYVRYRTISRRSAKDVSPAEQAERALDLNEGAFIIQELGTDRAAVYNIHDRGDKAEIMEEGLPLEDRVGKEDFIDPSGIQARIPYEEKDRIHTSRTIKDAIPVKREG
jgi:hypothetical protein